MSKKDKRKIVDKNLLDFIYMFAAPPEKVRVIVGVADYVFAVVSMRWGFKYVILIGKDSYSGFANWKAELQAKMNGKWSF